MKEMSSARLWAGISVLILLVSVFTVGMVLSIDTVEDETYFLVYKRGITADELTEVNGLTILADYDEFVLVSSGARDMNELMHQGHTIEALYDREDVYLHSHSFNVGEGLPEIPGELHVDSYPAGVRRPYIVQFIGPIMADWQNELMSMGVMPQEYRHRYNYLVEMDRDTAKAVSSLEFVNWVGIYQPAYKFDNALLDEQGVLDLEIYSFTSVDTLALAQYISGMGVEVRLIRDGHLFVETHASNLVAIANMPHVITITPRVTDLHFMNADATWVAQTGEIGNRKVTDMGVIGLGELITVMDSELYPDHEAFADPDGNPIGDTHRKIQAHYIPGDAGGDLESGVYHGTHVSGSVLGQSPPYDSYSNHDGNAMGARLIFQDVSPGFIVSPPSDMYNDGWGEPYSWGSRVHTNSWGGGSGYSGLAITADEFIWDHKDFNILFAAGNSGPDADSISNQGEAKNILTVGAVRNYDNHNNVARFSSRGYATDGRIKPTILHVGAQLNSADQTADGYSSMSGTSMSCPSLAGQVGQVRHYYTGGWYPSGVANPGDGFNPSGALVKATLINGAVEVSGVGAHLNDERFPNNDQGFGRSMLDRSLYFEGDDRKVYVFDSWNEDVELSTGESWEMEFSVEDATQELEVTLVWSDHPGTSTGPAIVNDLDLELFTPGGTRYVGNAFTGFNPGYSQPNPTSNPWNGPRSGAWDGLNVEENILLLPAENGVEEGVYQLTVSAHQVAQGTQPFAVVVSGGISDDVTPGPSIELTRPTGGEVWDTGATEEIAWTTTPVDGTTITGVDLEFSLDGGSSWDYVVEDTGDTGTYSWTLPEVSTLDAMVRATVHDDQGMSGRDTSDLFAILGDPPAPPSNLNVELVGLAEVLENNIFHVDYNPWLLTREVDQGEARWDSESYMEGGSIYVSAEAEGEEIVLTELSYWEQSIEPTTEELTISGTYRKLITVDSGFGWATYVHNATVEILVHDTVDGWQTVLIDEEISDGDSGWNDFEAVVYTPTGSVDNVRVLLHVTAEGDTGPFGGAQSATGELWVDRISVAQVDEDATENNLLTWDASPDDPDTVNNYEIFRADNQDGVRWGIPLATVDAHGSASYSYTDYGAGTADEIVWWYVVNAVNEHGQSDGNEVAVPEPSTPGPSIELTRPTGGEIWYAGTTESITWTATPAEGATITGIDIEFSSNGGTSWSYIEQGLTNTGSYSWSIPQVSTSDARIRTTVHDDNGQTGRDTSGSFSIMGDPPAPPSDLAVEHVGEGGLVVFDDFSDGDYTNDPTWTVYDGDWSVEQSGDNYWLEGIGQISTPHTQAYGAWEWDFQFVRNAAGRNNQMRFYFIQDQPEPDVGNCSGYYIIVVPNMIGGDPTINLWRLDEGEPPEEPLVSDTWPGNEDWNTLRVERDDTGVFSVYLNGDLVGSPSSPDNTYTSSTHIGFRHSAGQDTDRNRVSEVRVMGTDGTGYQHNLLSWQASPDDPGTVEHYSIYRSEESSGPWDQSTLIENVTATGASSYSYTDINKGMADDIYWWYVVRAVNEFGQTDGNADAVQEPTMNIITFDISLLAGGDSDGWNFVSFNLISFDTDLESILEDATYGISGNYDRVMYYDSSSDSWYTYVPGRPSHYNSLRSWDRTMGIWIRMNTADTLTVEGFEPVSTMVQLDPGWNMVGLPSSTSGTHNLPAEVTRVGFFNAADEYNVEYINAAGFVFQPGRGYWVYNSADQSIYWTVDY